MWRVPSGTVRSPPVTRLAPDRTVPAPPPCPPRLTARPDPRDGLGLLAIGLVGVVALVLGGGALLLRTVEALVPRTRVVALEHRGFDAAAPPPSAAPDDPAAAPLTGVRDVLVVGLDTREGLTDEQLLQLGTEDNGSRLTDTVMWVQYDADEDEVRMVSFPRDLAVAPDGHLRKLNALHRAGGPELLVTTVEDLVGEDLDHYVEVDLAGFIRLADTLDGVEVCLPEPMRDREAGVRLPAGCQQLSATQAAGIVRARHVADRFGTGTAGRAARQQYFIRQAVAEAVSSSTLTSPARLGGLVALARESVVVDAGFSTGELLRFANAFRTFDPDQIVGATVPFTSSRLDDGLFYDQLTDEAEDLFAAMRTGGDLPASLATSSGE
jgi:LCP family protein required for cell wall assembly